MAVDTDLVRILIGDSDISSQMLTDDQVEAICANYSSSTLAAAACADAIAARFSRSVTFAVEGLTIQNSQKAKAYLDMAQRLRGQATLNDAGGIGAPTVSGISKSQMEAIDDDTDRDPNRFKVGMSDFPGTMAAGAIDDDGLT